MGQSCLVNFVFFDCLTASRFAAVSTQEFVDLRTTYTLCLPPSLLSSPSPRQQQSPEGFKYSTAVPSSAHQFEVIREIEFLQNCESHNVQRGENPASSCLLLVGSLTLLPQQQRTHKTRAQGRVRMIAGRRKKKQNQELFFFYFTLPIPPLPWNDSMVMLRGLCRFTPCTTYRQ